MNEPGTSVDAPQGADTSKKKLISGVVIVLACLVGTVVLVAGGALVAMAGGMAGGSNAGEPDEGFYNIMALSPCLIVPILMIVGIVSAVWIYKKVNK